MSPRVPRLLAGLIDNAAMFPSGNLAPAEAVRAHRRHRDAWYADLVGPLLVRASEIPAAGRALGDLVISLIGDAGIDGLPAALADVAAHRAVRVRQVEVAVAKRGEDPQPGLARLIAMALPHTVYAEIPLSIGLLSGLDTLASARATGAAIAAKFRTGGLAAELFPTPIELAAVICACRDREIPFKLAAGLHHALRHTDPQTGLRHHGFLNILVATARAAGGADVTQTAAILAEPDPVPLIETTRRLLSEHRPLWIGYGSYDLRQPLSDLANLGLL